jgi:hypothetical protein
MTLSLTGNGSLYDGDKHLGETSYRLEFTSPELRGGLWRSRGTVGGEGVDLRALVSRTDTPVLTLHLEHGLAWNCRIRSEDGDLSPVGKRVYRREDGGEVPWEELAALSQAY